MNKKFYRFGDSYVAVDYDAKTVCRCILADDSTSAQFGTGDRFIMNLDSLHLHKEISEAEFSVQFTSAVARLHSQSPYS
nr:hypothetical protein [uncultured Draconibacterium sp.]